MPDLCPKGTDLGVKPSAPSCPLTLPLSLNLKITTEQAEDQGIPTGRVASVSIEVFNAASDYFGFNRNSDSQSRGGTENQN